MMKVLSKTINLAQTFIQIKTKKSNDDKEEYIEIIPIDITPVNKDEKIQNIKE